MLQKKTFSYMQHICKFGSSAFTFLENSKDTKFLFFFSGVKCPSDVLIWSLKPLFRYTDYSSTFNRSNGNGISSSHKCIGHWWCDNDAKIQIIVYAIILSCCFMLHTWQMVCTRFAPQDQVKIVTATKLYVRNTEKFHFPASANTMHNESLEPKPKPH